MSLRLHNWTRRFLNLGAGVLICSSVGCATTKDDSKPITNQVSKTTMGPGNTTMTPAEPISPAYANLAASGQTVTRNLNPPPTYNNQLPAMPSMPTGTSANPSFINTANMPTNPNNPPNFNSIVAPVQRQPQLPATAGYGGMQSAYPPQQPMGGTPMNVPTLSPPPGIPQPVPPQQQLAAQSSQQFQQLSPSSNQMQNIQLPTNFPQASSGVSPQSNLTQFNSNPQPQLAPPSTQPTYQPIQQVVATQPSSQSNLSQFNSNPQPRPVPPSTPQSFQSIQPAVPTQLSAAPGFVQPQSVQPVLPMFPGAPSAYGSPLVPSGPNPTSMTNPNGGSNATIAANVNALQSSMAPSAKTVASSVRGVTDPSMNINEPVVEAPTTVPSVGR